MNDLIGWIAFEVCNAKTYELFLSTNVYKRFDPRVIEREERIGINRGLPTMVYPTLFSFSRHFVCFEFYSSSGESHRWKEARSSITLGNRIFFVMMTITLNKNQNITNFGFTHINKTIDDFGFQLIPPHPKSLIVYCYSFYFVIWNIIYVIYYVYHVVIS
jgi:hypothetical protein